MKTPNYTLLLILILSLSLPLISQEKVKNEFAFKGTVIDDANGESIPFVNIFNENTRRWAISNEAGNYSLSLSTGDTLVFTAIGFLGKVYIVEDGFQEQNHIISLATQNYEIEEVKVLGYRNYEDFQKAFLELELPESDIQKVKEKLNIEGTIIAMKADYERRAKESLSKSGVGFSFSSGGSGNADKLLREKLDREATMQRAVDKKYNRGVVFEITKLPEDELTNFMGFCNFSLEYLYNTNEYDILVRIDELFKIYKVKNDTCS